MNQWMNECYVCYLAWSYRFAQLAPLLVMKGMHVGHLVPLAGALLGSVAALAALWLAAWAQQQLEERRLAKKAHRKPRGQS